MKRVGGDVPTKEPGGAHSEVIVALGSNLGDRDNQMTTARTLLRKNVGSIELCSSLYETEPLLHPDSPTLGQEKFLNAVLLLKTKLKPRQLLSKLQEIESLVGRNRAEEPVRWGPRVLDLDIIAIGEVVLNFRDLFVPHPEMHRRAFVLEPLREILPEWRHPVLGKSVAELLADLPQEPPQEPGCGPIIRHWPDDL